MKFIVLLLICTTVVYAEEGGTLSLEEAKQQIAQLEEALASKKVPIITEDNQVDGIEELSIEKLPEGVDPMIALEDAKDQLVVDREIIEWARKGYVESTNAQKLFHTPSRLRSITVPLSVDPGQDSYPINVAINYGVTLHFQNPNGETLFVHRYKTGVANVINVDDGSGDGDKTVSPYITLTNSSTVGATNLHVWLMDVQQSLSFYTKVVETDDEYVDRITFIIVDPSSKPPSNSLKLNAYDTLTLALSNQKPNNKAEKIRFNDPSVTAWKLGDMMWVRTKKRLVFPSYSPKMTLSSGKDDGVHVYYVAAHPIIHVINEVGRFEKLTLIEDVES